MTHEGEGGGADDGTKTSKPQTQNTTRAASQNAHRHSSDRLSSSRRDSRLRIFSGERGKGEGAPRAQDKGMEQVGKWGE